jgi:hypothetical protein
MLMMLAAGGWSLPPLFLILLALAGFSALALASLIRHGGLRPRRPLSRPPWRTYSLLARYRYTPRRRL